MSGGMRVLVTGATGFVGAHTAAALSAAGHTVLVLVRDPARMAAALDPFGLSDIDHVRGDVTSPASVEEALDGCDAVVHAAAVFTLDRRRDAEVHATNVGGTESVLGHAHAAGSDPIVHVSSVSALYPPRGRVLSTDDEVGHATSPYARSKAEAERFARRLQADGAPVVITYPGGIWGPDDPTRGQQVGALLEYVRRGFVPVSPGGIPLVDVRDVAAVHVAAMQPGRGPRRFMVGGTLLNQAELFDIIGDVTGRRFRHIPVSGALLRGVGRATDLVNRFVRLNTPLTHEAMVTLTRAVPADSEPTTAELGITFRPARETIADTLRWYFEQGLLRASDVGRLATAT